MGGKKEYQDGKDLKKKLIVGCSIILLIILVVSGCTSTQQKATKSKIAKEINFQSDVLQLVNSSVQIQEDKGIIYNVIVTLYFKNLLNNRINVNYVVDFCDKNDNILYSKPYRINNIPENYVFYTPDIFSYNGDNVIDFDHVNVHITNFEIIK